MPSPFPPPEPIHDPDQARSSGRHFTEHDVLRALGDTCTVLPDPRGNGCAPAVGLIGPLRIEIRHMQLSSVPVLDARVRAVRGATFEAERWIDLLDWNVRVGRNIGMLWSQNDSADGPRLGGTIDRSVLNDPGDAADWVATLVANFGAAVLGFVSDATDIAPEVPLALARAAGFAARLSAVPSADRGGADTVLRGLFGGAPAAPGSERLFLRRDGVPIGIYFRQTHGRLVLRITADLSPAEGIRDLRAVAERAALYNAGWPDARAGHLGILTQSRALLHTSVIDPLHEDFTDLDRAIDLAASLTWIGRTTFSGAADLLGFAGRLTECTRHR